MFIKLTLLKVGDDMRLRSMLLVSLSLLFFLISCSDNDLRQMEDAYEIGFNIVKDGITVNSGNLSESNIEKVIDWHNNSTFFSEVKEDILNATVPMNEELSNSNFRISIGPQNQVDIVYKNDSIFKVIHEDKRIAYNIKSPELLEFIRENKSGK